MAKFVVQSSRLVPTMDPLNTSGYDTLISYVGEDRKFHTVVVAAREPTDQQISDAIAAREQLRSDHAGKTFEV